MTVNNRDEDCIRRLAAVVCDSNDAITIQDFEGGISSWNRGAELMYGYSETKALSMNIDRLTASDKVTEQRDFIRRLIAGESVTSFETRRVASDGRVLDVWMTVTLLRDDEGNPTCIASTERDITERKRAEMEVQKRKEEFRALVESSSDMVWAVDADGRYTYVSPRVREILGYEQGELIGHTPFEFMEEKEGRKLSEIFARIIAERRPFSLLENVNVHKKDGRLVVLQTSGVPLFGIDGEFRGYHGMDRDITESKQAEDALRGQMEELQRWHDVTLGREGRVMELKQEVNALLAKAGQPLRYRDLTEDVETR